MIENETHKGQCVSENIECYLCIICLNWLIVNLWWIIRNVRSRIYCNTWFILFLEFIVIHHSLIMIVLRIHQNSVVRWLNIIIIISRICRWAYFLIPTSSSSHLCKSIDSNYKRSNYAYYIEGKNGSMKENILTSQSNCIEKYTWTHIVSLNA